MITTVSFRVEAGAVRDVALAANARSILLGEVAVDGGPPGVMITT